MQCSLTVDSMEPAPIARRPSLVNSLLEFRFPIEAAVLLWNYGIKRLRPQIDDSNRKIVMMIPGFMAGDLTLAPLAKFCEWLGHKTFFTGIWSNSRCPREMVQHLERNLEEIHASFGRVVIIGHSLGGMYALELALRRPDLIERVITLGSPIRSVEDSGHAFVLATARLIMILHGVDHGCLKDLLEGHPGEVRPRGPFEVAHSDDLKRRWDPRGDKNHQNAQTEDHLLRKGPTWAYQKEWRFFIYGRAVLQSALTRYRRTLFRNNIRLAPYRGRARRGSKLDQGGTFRPRALFREIAMTQSEAVV